VLISGHMLVLFLGQDPRLGGEFLQ